MAKWNLRKHASTGQQIWFREEDVREVNELDDGTWTIIIGGQTWVRELWVDAPPGFVCGTKLEDRGLEESLTALAAGLRSL